MDPQAHWVAACRAGELETAQTLWTTDEVHLTPQLWADVCATEHLSMVQWLSSLEPTPSPENGWVEACASGQLEIAQWLWTMERETADGSWQPWHAICEWEELDRYAERATRKAAAAGQLAILQWSTPLLRGYDVELEWENILRETCVEGQLEAAQWVQAQPSGAYWTESYLSGLWGAAYLRGQSEMATWLESLGASTDLQWLSGTHWIQVCERGHLSLAKQLWSGGCAGPEDVPEATRRSAKAGQLSVLRWLWDLRELSEERLQIAYREAAGGGHLAVMQWVETVITLPPTTSAEACSRAGWGGHLECLQWAARHGHRSHWQSLWESACASGQLEMAQWIDQQGVIDYSNTYPHWLRALREERWAMAQWLWDLHPRHTAEQLAAGWREVCGTSSLAMVRWVWGLGGGSGTTDHRVAGRLSGWTSGDGPLDLGPG